jgi:hypothetical protein
MTPSGRYIRRVFPKRATHEQRQIGFEYQFFSGAGREQDRRKEAGKVHVRFCVDFGGKFQSYRSKASGKVVRRLATTMILTCDISACEIPECGYATVRELAKAEIINESYLGRILRLTLLSPTLIEAILEGRQPANLELDDLFQQFPIEWDQQLGSLTEGG